MTEQATSAKDKFSSNEILVILLLALTQFTVVLDFMVMSPLGDMLMKSMDLSTSQFGFSVSAYAFSAGLSGLLTAGFADRFDRKKLLLFFYIGFILGTLFCGLTTSYPMLLAARIFTGLFGGVIGSISMAIVTDIFPIERRGRVMGFMQMGFGASQVLGIPISLYIANMWGWQSPFLMIVGLATIIWLVIVFKLQPINKHLALQSDRSAFSHLWHTVSKKNYRIGFLATAFLSLGGFMMMPWGSAFAVNNLHVTVHQLPILFMFSGVCSLIIMPVAGKLSDRFDKFKLFTIASVWLSIVVIIYTNMGPTAFWLVLIMNIGFMIGIMSRMVPAIALSSALPAKEDRGAFMGINASLQQIAGGAAAAVGGMIVVQQDKFSPLEHYDTLGYVIVVLSAISIFLLYRVSVIVKAQKNENGKG
ncbi:MFS transporter [Daejeonella lutea]|uniref:Predicted arabinose efflux permease, MFS family n=1 Tax=Daejeonella lutea TaxID=572036 RepID=A0A1T5EPT9_9SPHI|nr:MFS transporter [Daejeonella lutea]SKB85926.1 Predicted arabinose efflux permease, MFS family [Daejeonella lutea]